METLKTKSFQEAIKEVLRGVLMAAIAAWISELAVTIPVLFLSDQSKAIIFVGILAGLRFLDSYLHEYGKENGKPVLVKGLTRF